METKEYTMFTKTAIKERGWTEKMINTLLGEPLLKKNPYNLTGSYMKMWEIEEVEAAEKTPEYEVMFEKIQRRREKMNGPRYDENGNELRGRNASEVYSDRFAKMYEELDGLLEKVRIGRYPIEQIETWALEFATGGGDSSQIDEATMQRWCVNTIRHELTHYDEYLFDIADSWNSKTGAWYIKSEILNKIARAYPTLEEECKRQSLDSFPIPRG